MFPQLITIERVWEFRLEGALEARRDGRVVPVSAERHRALLTCLLERPGEVVALNELVARVGVGPGAVRTYVMRLRKILGADLIRTVGTGYLIAVPPEAVDVYRSVGPMFQLPAPVRTFVGREGQIAEICGRLPGVVVVTGPPGAGKTTLAVAAAHRVAAEYPDGQLHANLRGYDQRPPVPVTSVLARFLRTLGVPAERVPLDLGEQRARFRSLLAGKRVLLLLDNVADTEHVLPLLPDGCAAIVTSRVTLDVGVPVRVGALGHDEALALLGAFVGPDRVREPAAAQLVELCAGLPLAVCISGANLAAHPDLPLADHVAELRHDRLAVLEVDGDDQSAVRAAFDLSYASLKPEPRTLFRRLGLVPGPDFTLDAVRALGGDSPALAVLESAHLVEQHEPGRFRLHDLLRLYAAEQCAEEDADARVALFDFYVVTANALADRLHPRRVAAPGPSGEPGAFDEGWFDAELANLVAVVEEASASGPHRVAWQLASPLHVHFESRRPLAEWVRVGTAALSAAEHDGDRFARLLCHAILANAYLALCKHDQALAQYDHALEMADTDELRAMVVNRQGLVLLIAGRLREAEARYGTALEIADRIGLAAGRIAARVRLGDVHWELGALGEAHAWHTEAVEVARDASSLRHWQLAIGHLGWSEMSLGLLDEAAGHLAEALGLAGERGDRSDEARIRVHLAAVRREQGRYDEALAQARAALALATELGSLRSQAGSRHVLGSTLVLLGRFDEAMSELNAALELSTAADHPRGQGDALVSLAELTGNREFAERGLRISERTGHGLVAAAARRRLNRW